MDKDSLRAISFLRELDDSELDAFAALIAMRDCRPGERVIEEGVPPVAFYIVVDGVVHVRRLSNKREMLLARLGPGSFFGEINLFDPGVASASIYTMKAARLAVITYDRFRGFLDDNPRAGCRIVCGLMREMAQRLRATSARIANTVFWSDKAGL